MFWWYFSFGKHLRILLTMHVPINEQQKEIWSLLDIQGKTKWKKNHLRFRFDSTSYFRKMKFGGYLQRNNTYTRMHQFTLLFKTSLNRRIQQLNIAAQIIKIYIPQFSTNSISPSLGFFALSFSNYFLRSASLGDKQKGKKISKWASHCHIHSKLESFFSLSFIFLKLCHIYFCLLLEHLIRFGIWNKKCIVLVDERWFVLLKFDSKSN